tara:strand:- start:168 stop:515 length:348 start_codon:yes stop_codon:yes gene_type:complete
MPDSMGEFSRAIPTAVSQAWLDQFRNHLPSTHFNIEGDEPAFDEGADGIPDKGWKIADIRSWLGTYDMNPKGYATKSGLLKLVDDVLNPAMAEDVMAEAEEQAEAETATEETQDE